MTKAFVQSITRYSSARVSALAIALLATSIGGCGGASNSLDGSLSQVYTLNFDSVEAQLVGQYFVVQYLVTATGAKTLELSVDLTGYTVVPNVEIALAGSTGMAPDGLPRGTFERVDSATTDLVASTAGLTLDQVPAVNAALSGSFHATFSDPAGQAVDGKFSVSQVTSP